MAKAPAKKKAAAKAAPSSSAKTVKRRNGTVTFGKNVTIGKGAS
ncbi:hypothetical protein [Limnobacter sp.]|nr:hypothetical protein [Limnobacter sp.]